MSKKSGNTATPKSLSEGLGLSETASLLFRLKGKVFKDWESQCREKLLTSKLQSHPALLNEIPKFINQLILSLSPDFKTDFEVNSKAKSKVNPKIVRDPGQEHSDLGAYKLDQVIHEYQILRIILIEILEGEGPLRTEVRKLIHEFTDQEIRKSASRQNEIQPKIKNYQQADSVYDIQELNAFFMQAPVAICVLEGPEHIFTLSNPIYDKLSGREVIGKKVREVFNEAEAGPFFEILDRVFLTGEPYVGKETCVQLVGSGGEVRERFIDFGYHPIRNSENKITSILAFHIDVTDPVLARKNLENSEARLLNSQDMLKNMKQIADHQRANLAAVFAQTPGAIAVFEGPDHVFKMANPSYLSQFFGGRKDLIGQPVRLAVPEVVEQGFEKLLDTVYQTGEPYVGTETPIDLLQPDGKLRKFYLNLMYQPLRDTSEKIIGIVAVITDVTDQVHGRIKLQEGEALLIKNQEMLSTTVRVAKVGFYDWDIQKNSVTFSDLMRKDWGVESSVGSLQDALDRIHPDDREKTGHLIETSIKDRSPLFTEYRVVRPDGSIIWIEAQGVVEYSKDGTPNRFYGTSIDITARKAAQLQLQAAKSEAEKANQTKSSFLANMSHEIRTPLGAILGFTDLLKDGELSDKERNHYLETIARNGKALTTIIDDILDLAKVESGKLEVENLDFSLFDLIDDVMDIFRERTRSKNIFLRAHINKGTPDRVFSDPTRIRQILINVVGNAVKFTEHGGVTIEVSENEIIGKKTQFKILVKDTGIGLNGEQKERLFQPFMQADNSTTRKFGGTGLGLNLSKRLASALGGDIFIEATDTVEAGCTFGFTFVTSILKPVANEVKIKNKALKNKGEKIKPLSGIRVLLAEDFADNQLLVQLVLTNQGAKVETANNGLEAFKMGMDGNFDIVLMDSQMPKMDGYEATHALREAGFKKPIVALTAHAMPEERARTLAAGCNGHLTKPLNQVELIETIKRLTSAKKVN